MTKSISESNQNRPRWYKRLWFLTLLNAIGEVVGFWGSVMLVMEHIMFSRGNLPIYIHLLCAVIGMILGTIVGYTIWVCTDDFPLSSIGLMSGLWAITGGSTFLFIENALFMAFIPPIMAYLLTFLILHRGEQSTIFLIASLPASLVGILLFGFTLQYGEHLLFATGAVTGGFFGLVLIGMFRFDAYFNNTPNISLQLQQELASGLLPEGEFVVGDDGELVEISDDETQSRGNIS